MDQPAEASSGWEYVANSEAAASLLDVAIELPADDSVTRSELAGRAGVPLKQLYLEETIQTLLQVGVFEVVEADDEEETRYVANQESDVLAAAQRFDRALADRLSGE